jgi:DNA-binding response OmpR family regulator
MAKQPFNNLKASPRTLSGLPRAFRETASAPSAPEVKRLTPLEARLVKVLSRPKTRSQFKTRAELRAEVWEGRTLPGIKSVAVLVSCVNAKRPGLIENRPSYGYRICA